MSFYNMIYTQFEKKIKKIRSDNGGEFVSNVMFNFYEEKGIILETSCIHTPQQNLVIERKHRHLLEIARELRFTNQVLGRMDNNRYIYYQLSPIKGQL